MELILMYKVETKLDYWSFDDLCCCLEMQNCSTKYFVTKMYSLRLPDHTQIICFIMKTTIIRVEIPRYMYKNTQFQGFPDISVYMSTIPYVYVYVYVLKNKNIECDM